MKTPEQIANILRKISTELEEIDDEIMQYQDVRESVVMYLRNTLRNTQAQIKSTEFYIEALLKVRVTR